jgi:hypothetical protein
MLNSIITLGKVYHNPHYRILTEASRQSVGNLHGNKRITECATNLEEKEERFEERCSVEASEH